MTRWRLILGLLLCSAITVLAGYKAITGLGAETKSMFASGTATVERSRLVQC